MSDFKGEVFAVSGPTVVVKGMRGARMHTTCKVGTDGLFAEVVRIDGDLATLQVFEDTTGLSVGEGVECSGRPLTVRLGPGLLANVFDGIQRPLPATAELEGDFIRKGFSIAPFDMERAWDFEALKKVGDAVAPGDVLGEIEETRAITHRVMVPPGVSGKILEIKEGSLTGDDKVCILEGGTEIGLYQDWPVREARPFLSKRPSKAPFITGQRIFDTVLPVAEGGTAVVPGGFGTGKTVIDQTIAKSSLCDVVIYIGCGERGNEMTEVLSEFPLLKDPVRGLPLSERTVLVVNTSNMPVAAREASIFTGITIGEYFRDMGYSVAILTDSISRWAEALREISSRLEEMPGEEGYPSYLSTRLGKFYERAGRVECLGGDAESGRVGSVTIISAVSPPGGDFSEPVTQTSLRYAGALWALDADLAHRRHFPAVDWKKSFSLYYKQLAPWYASEVAPDMEDMRTRLLALLEKESELQEITQVIGIESLQDGDRLTLEVASIARESFLRQNVFNKNDAFATFEKQYWMLKTLFGFLDSAKKVLEGGGYLDKILETHIKSKLLKMSGLENEGFEGSALKIIGEIAATLRTLEQK